MTSSGVTSLVGLAPDEDFGRAVLVLDLDFGSLGSDAMSDLERRLFLAFGVGSSTTDISESESAIAAGLDLELSSLFIGGVERRLLVPLAATLATDFSGVWLLVGTFFVGFFDDSFDQFI